MDTAAAVADLVDRLLQLKTDAPSTFIDLDGVNLSRDGCISIITLMTREEGRSEFCLIDVHGLQQLAFNTSGTKDTTFKQVLESRQIPKVFFGVRNDSDALYAHSRVDLKGVENVQLMENASRHPTQSKKYTRG